MIRIKTYQTLSGNGDASEPSPRGKFVLLLQDDTLHLVLSPIQETPFHANIVHRYLHGEGLAKVEMRNSSQCRIVTPGWKVRGGGYYEIHPEERQLRLWGKSTAFGKYDVEKLRVFADQIPGLLGLEGFRLLLN